MVSVKSMAGVVSTGFLDWVGSDSMPPATALQTWLSEGSPAAAVNPQNSGEQLSNPDEQDNLAQQAPSGDEAAKLGVERASTLTVPEGDDGGGTGSSSPRPSVVSSKRSGEGLQDRIASNPDNPQIRVQALINGDWVDSSQREVKQISYHLAAGESKFTVAARGTLYVVDFSNPEGATQTNPATGRVRQLRVLETAEDSESSFPEAGDRQAGGSAGPPRRQESSDAAAALQRRYGPQSKRGAAPQYQLGVLEHNPHARECFAKLAANEEALCDEWAAFYHSYSFAALVYEVHAAVAAVLFRFRSEFASLPRLLAGEFATMPNAKALLDRFNREFASSSKDHHPAFRKVAISAMCSLVALGPEASTPVVFVSGYSEKDLNFLSVLEGLLISCYVPKSKVKKLASSIIALSEQHGLDVSQFGGKPCESRNAGHLLQIFIKRKLVDQLAYASQPYGLLDPDRHPLSDWVNGDVNANYGQVRVLAHPKLFMSAKSVRMFVVSADPVFHRSRQKFQEELTKLLDVILGDPALRLRAATGIWGGKLPPWWTSEDQRAHRPAPKAPADGQRLGGGASCLGL
ncbi:unnamed protein product [Prorocentrum cordatum]|uniref:Uncharacterized protein n=1 Tax=Prorocentrum cordatum TaxID=2364126 RepID=A0ABN9PHU5_9DINO|nr:unnamed protein product [Polarella glacialis]